MNWKWYIPLLILALVFLGTGIERSTLPNQEIVVQFDTYSINADEAQLAVSEITSQLEAIGVTDLHVSKLHHGKLKVSYYSTIDVAVIKNLFYKQNKLQLGGTAFDSKDGASNNPFHSDLSSYRLEVVQIQKDLLPSPGLQGLPVTLKWAKDQYLKPILSLGSPETTLNLKRSDESTVFKNYRNVLLLIDNPSYIFPEVRAGPFS